MAQPIVMPSMGMYTEEGTLTAWLRPSGDRVETGEAIAEITTEKVTFEIPASTAGILHQIAEVGANLRVEQLLGYILAEGEAVPGQPAPEAALGSGSGNGQREMPPVEESSHAGGPPRASPAARRLASQHGIDLQSVRGSGPGGRIVEADVLAKMSK
ncbi:MAG: E3 binding domain-containing protein [Acidobacteriota bacterium]|nr:E3 binding domain-containing protein [Acidobacteriota bacterium]